MKLAHPVVDAVAVTAVVAVAMAAVGAAMAVAVEVTAAGAAVDVATAAVANGAADKPARLRAFSIFTVWGPILQAHLLCAGQLSRRAVVFSGAIDLRRAFLLAQAEL